VALDPVFLSRLQFAFVMSFHILFPSFTIGLAAYLAVLEGLWLKSGNTIYRRLSEFWVKIFAVSFGMGVVSGIVMSYQFGTNWSELIQVAGNVLGPLMGYEVVTAFFLEATFLGILLFGRDRVAPWLYFVSSVVVSLGTLMSAFWILSANSWMQTPAGVEMRDGVLHVTSWLAVIFNPSFPFRFAHMLTACFLTTAFVVGGVSAWYLRRDRVVGIARKGLSMALGLIVILAPLQVLIGDAHGLNTLEHQPAKIAAMEGHWKTEPGAPLILFALPDAVRETNHYSIEIPKLGSLILTHDPEGTFTGLEDFPRDERPPVTPVFFSFRLMVGIGVLMVLIGLVGLWLRFRGRMHDTRWFLAVCQYASPIGFVAILAGWVTTEVGRQPWVAYGLLRTSDAVSPAISGGNVLTSLIAFGVAYAFIFGFGLYYLYKIARGGPKPVEEEHHTGHPTPMRPLSFPGESI